MNCLANHVRCRCRLRDGVSGGTAIFYAADEVQFTIIVRFVYHFASAQCPLNAI